MRPKGLARSSAASLTRLAEAKVEVAAIVDPTPVTRGVRTLTKPASPGGGMRKLGIALIAAPDPITAVPGVALLASSYVLKKNEPMTIENLAQETRKVLRDIQSLSL